MRKESKERIEWFIRISLKKRKRVQGYSTNYYITDEEFKDSKLFKDEIDVENFLEFLTYEIREFYMTIYIKDNPPTAGSSRREVEKEIELKRNRENKTTLIKRISTSMLEEYKIALKTIYTHIMN